MNAGEPSRMPKPYWEWVGLKPVIVPLPAYGKKGKPFKIGDTRANPERKI